jgi:hypothetical protein
MRAELVRMSGLSCEVRRDESDMSDESRHGMLSVNRALTYDSEGVRMNVSNDSQASLGADGVEPAEANRVHFDARGKGVWVKVVVVREIDNLRRGCTRSAESSRQHEGA